MAKSQDPIQSFSDLNLHKSLSDAVVDLGFTQLTPVQTAAIPQFLNHKDVIVEAVTGSGKTLAFLLPTVQILFRRGDPWKQHEIGAVVLSPTRELALQTTQVLQKLLKYSEFRCCSWIGGRSAAKDVEEFKTNGGHIVVATPGRFLDLIEHYAHLRALLKSVEVLVLDEADRLLEMGFEVTLSAILTHLPKQRRTGMFSATQTTELKQLIRAGMRNPVVIKVQEKKHLRTPVGLCSYFTVQPTEGKLDHLVSFLKSHPEKKHLLFFATCDCVNYFTKLLERALKNSTVLSLHRKLKHKRQAIFQEFSALEKGVLVCTDVVARGIDWPDIDWVIQFDIPKSAAVYVHRCGRTARLGGRLGGSLLYVMPNEEPYVEFIKRNQQVSLLPFDDSSLSVNYTGSSSRLKIMARKDRAIYDHGMKAFVSYVRAYGQHECSLICRTKDLNLGALAESFGLLKLPKMPELKDITATFEESDLEVQNIAYKDKIREKQRQVNLTNPSNTFADKANKRNKHRPLENFSLAKAKRLHTKERRLLKQIKKKKHTLEFDQTELDDLARDARLIKQERLKKISRDKFNKDFADGDSDFEGDTEMPVV